MAGTQTDVLRMANGFFDPLRALLRRFEIDVVRIAVDEDIPGSFWGNPEAGIIGNTLFARDDTPLHSALHEAAHIICMSAPRRARLVGDAGGSDLEEAAVCYLQITLADWLPGAGAARLMQDMDRWGYSFRLGSAAQWRAEDAADARDWLARKSLIDSEGQPSWRLRH